MNFAKYVNTYPYPTKSDFTSTYYYKEGKLVATSTLKELQHHIPEIDLGWCTKEVIFDTEKFTAERDKYFGNNSVLQANFKKDLADELGLTNHPKWDILYKLASADSDSFEDTYNIAEELAELLY